jgi:hypothetical protein
MDDYNTSVLTEAKNEYSANLVNILTPLLIQGLQSIFKEACDLCVNNEENEKYLMTFQNFLTRVPKWNQQIIENETTRIVQGSRCNYLEDLLTCVHITQLKILTSIRVATHQKKIDIDVPKLSNFIHNVYIKCARKFYSSVYIFETNIKPLEHQKNMRECEMICKECILNTVRESMPIEKILRAYMDETTEEEIVEEEINEQVEEEKKEEKEENAISDEVKSEIKKVADAIKNKEEVKSEEVKSEENVKLVIEDTIKDLEKKIETNNSTEEKSKPLAIQVETEKAPKRESIKFNDVDSVINYDTKESPKNSLPAPTDVSAPKTIDRLEEISQIRNEQRKLEEEDDDDDEEKLTIFGDAPSLKLDALDIQVLDKTLKLEKPPLLTGIETLI